MFFYIDETETDVTVESQVATTASQTDENVTVDEPLQAAAAACQADQNFTAKEQSLYAVLGEMTNQFLAYTIDTKRGNITDKLVAKNILSLNDKETIKAQKNIDAKVRSLLGIMREKSGDEFESFLAALSETGQ